MVNYNLRSQSKSKYSNTKVTLDGINFLSKKEARRYLELKLLLKSNAISDLKLQPRFKLWCLNPQTMERELVCVYVADFQYIEHSEHAGDNEVVEDVKGKKTRDYIIKAKMFKICYPQYVFREI